MSKVGSPFTKRSFLNIPTFIVDSITLLGCQVRDSGSPRPLQSFTQSFTQSCSVFQIHFECIPSPLFFAATTMGMNSLPPNLHLGLLWHKKNSFFYHIFSHVSVPVQEPRGLTTTLPDQIWTPLLLCERAIIWGLLVYLYLPLLLKNTCVLPIFYSHFYERPLRIVLSTCVSSLEARILSLS